jgi:5-methylcytosine-specific restriction endonuclease McrA
MRNLRTPKIRAYEQKYREKMRLWTSQLRNKNRVKDAGLDGEFSIQQWKDLLEKHNHCCVMCGKKVKLTYDHIIPLKRFKKWAEVNHPSYRANDIENIQPLCGHCNGSKGTK